MEPKPPELEIIVTADTRGRLDIFLSRAVEGLSRRAAAALIEQGAVTVDERPAVKSEQVVEGGRIAVFKPLPKAIWEPLPDTSIMLSVLYQDDDVVLVDKPSGISSVPLAPDEKGTLAGAVVAIFPECAAVGRRVGDGGLLQRLDKETSGAVMAARSQEVHDRLTEAQTRGEIEKRYLALVKGTPPPRMRIDTPLGPYGEKGKKMRPDPKGQKAETEVRVVSKHGDYTLVEATIRHGVRHQIRAHLAQAGHPIAGDPLYGETEGPPGLDRLFLHAHEVSFRRPVTGDLITVRSELPEALGRNLALHAQAKR